MMAKTSLDIDLIKELRQLKEEIERREGDYESAREKMERVGVKLVELRQEWDDKVSALPEDLRVLLINTRVREQVKPETTDRERLTQWYTDTLKQSGGAMDKSKLKGLFDKETGLGDRFRPDLQKHLVVDKDKNTVSLKTA